MKNKKDQPESLIAKRWRIHIKLAKMRWRLALLRYKYKIWKIGDENALDDQTVL